MHSSISFIDHFSDFPDPRISGMRLYPLEELLLCTLTGVLCRGDDWSEILLVCQEEEAWLRQFLPFSNGIASERTFRRVFGSLNTEQFNLHFCQWVASFSNKLSGVVAIDGKCLRGSKQSKDASCNDARTVVSAFAHKMGLVMGQRTVDAKSNEITAIPTLLEMLALEGAIVTIDAMGTQKDIATSIREKGADYLLALKGNQETLHEDVQLYCEEHSPDVAWNTHHTLDTGHGRIEERRCWVTDDIAWLRQRHPEWTELRSVVMVEGKRHDKKYGKDSEHTRYYITSLPPNAEVILAATRAHWSIENRLHWVLDVAFREDENRSRAEHIAQNLAVVRHAVLNMLRKQNDKLSIKRRRLKAAFNTEYRKKLIM